MNRHTMLTICIWFDTVCTSLSFTFHQDNRSVILRYWLLLAAVIILFVIWAMNVRQLWICCCSIAKRGNNGEKKTNFVDIILLKNFQFNFNFFFLKQLTKNCLLFRMIPSIYFYFTEWDAGEVMFIESKFGKLRDQSTSLIKQISSWA